MNVNIKQHYNKYFFKLFLQNITLEMYYTVLIIIETIQS